MRLGRRGCNIHTRRGSEGADPKAPTSVRQQFLEVFDFVAQSRIVSQFSINLADRVQNCCVVAVAEPATDLR